VLNAPNMPLGQNEFAQVAYSPQALDPVFPTLGRRLPLGDIHPQYLLGGAGGFSNSGAGGSNGTTVTTGNSGGSSGQAFDTVSIGGTGTLTFDNTNPITTGGLDYKFVTDASSDAIYVAWLPASLGGPFYECWGRVYFNFPATPAANTSLVVACYNSFANGNKPCSLSLSTGGHILAQYGAGATNAGSTVLSTNTTYRVEWHFALAGNGSGDLIEYYLYVGDSTSATEHYSHNDIANSGPPFSMMDRVAYGPSIAVGASFTVYLAGLNVNGTGFPGPLNAAISDTGAGVGDSVVEVAIHSDAISDTGAGVGDSVVEVAVYPRTASDMGAG